MEKVVLAYLGQCLALFPMYGEADADLIRLRAEIFTRIFVRAGLSENDVGTGFEYHLRTSKQFPVPSDIIDAVKPVTLYKFNNGPLGYGGLYRADHPYTIKQMGFSDRLSTITARACDVERLTGKREADREEIEAIDIDTSALAYRH